MSHFPPPPYYIRPADPAAEGLSTGPPTNCPPEVPVTVDRNFQLWEFVKSENNGFNVQSTAKCGYQLYKWFNKNNDLYARFFGHAEDFRIESAGDGLWIFYIFGKDLVLTYDAKTYPQLTFKPADGSSAQRFRVIPLVRAS